MTVINDDERESIYQEFKALVNMQPKKLEE